MNGDGKIHRNKKRAAPQPKRAVAAGAGAATNGRRPTMRKAVRERADAPSPIQPPADPAENGVAQNALPLYEIRNRIGTDIERALGTEIPDEAVRPRPATSIE